MGELCVKFVNCNENTLKGIELNLLKFSTVYELNDFNEFRYISPFWKKDEKFEKYKSKISEHLSNLFGTEGKRCELKKNLVNTRYKTKYSNKMCDLMSSDFSSFKENIPEEYRQMTIENIAFSSVGIYCCSNIEVFCLSDAQVMFAHYADNLNGLALIYELDDEKNFENVEYTEVSCDSAGWVDRVFHWADDNYQDMGDFKKKLLPWHTEQERRLFYRPGLHCASCVGLTLKAILYTKRLSKERLEKLEEVNRSKYKGKLIIEEIYPGSSTPTFKFVGGKFKDKEIIEWVNSLQEKPIDPEEVKKKQIRLYEQILEQLKKN